jgi:hypothetical protein
MTLAEDALRRAKMVIADWFGPAGQHVLRHLIVGAIEDMVRAERERCVKIIDGWEDDPVLRYGYAEGDNIRYAPDAEAIVARIRQGGGR